MHAQNTQLHRVQPNSLQLHLLHLHHLRTQLPDIRAEGQMHEEHIEVRQVRLSELELDQIDLSAMRCQLWTVSQQTALRPAQRDVRSCGRGVLEHHKYELHCVLDLVSESRQAEQLHDQDPQLPQVWSGQFDESRIDLFAM